MTARNKWSASNRLAVCHRHCLAFHRLHLLLCYHVSADCCRICLILQVVPSWFVSVYPHVLISSFVHILTWHLFVFIKTKQKFFCLQAWTYKALNPGKPSQCFGPVINKNMLNARTGQLGRAVIEPSSRNHKVSGSTPGRCQDTDRLW